MRKLITVKRAAGDKVIVEMAGSLPQIYNSFTEMVVNEFYPPEVMEEFKASSSMDLFITVEINPPKST